MNWTFLSILVCVVLLLAALKYYYQRWKLGIPGPWGYPIVGIWPTIYKLRMREDIGIYDFLTDVVKQYGNTFVFTAPTKPWLVNINEPEDIKHVLDKNFKNYIKGERIHSILFGLLGDGIFNSDGDLWERQRKTASHLFKVKELKHMIPVFVKHAKELMEILQTHADNGTSIDMEALFARFTLDSIGEIAFGVDIGSLKKEHPFSLAFNQAQEIIDIRFTKFYWKWLGKWMKSERDLAKALNIIDEFAYGVIDQRMLESEQDLQTKTDLLSRYLLMIKQGEKFDRKYLRDIIINFMIAGRDTTSQTLTWMFYLLSQNTNATEKLHALVDEKFKGAIPDDYDMLMKNMKYMDGAVNETLRMYPPVPWETKMAIGNDILPGSMTKIRKGYVINYSPWVLGRHEDFWEHPTAYIPDRWLPDTNLRTYKHTPPFIPFNYGRRTCLGQNMAYLEVKLMASMILQQFDLQMDPDQVVMYHPRITISTKYGMRMIPKRRKINTEL